MLRKVDLAASFDQIAVPWAPHIAGALNGQHVKLVKLSGPFVWHAHDDADELFLVVKGGFRMELRDGNIDLEEGQMLVVPRGVEHRPVADHEAWVLLFEPEGTLNTGNAGGDLTVERPKWI